MFVVRGLFRSGHFGSDVGRITHYVSFPSVTCIQFLTLQGESTLKG